MKSFYHLLSTVFFLGHTPVASGTWGTGGAMAGVLLYAHFCPASWPYLPLSLGLAGVLFLLGIPAATWAERKFRRKDPSEYVLDEVIGYLIAVAWITPPSWEAALIAFFLFRATDIIKVYPGNRAENLPGGYGIILDDVVAGLYALIFMIPVRIFLFP